MLLLVGVRVEWVEGRADWDNHTQLRVVVERVLSEARGCEPLIAAPELVVVPLIEVEERKVELAQLDGRAGLSVLEAEAQLGLRTNRE